MLSVKNNEGDVILYKGGISNDVERRINDLRLEFGRHDRTKEYGVEAVEVVPFDDGRVLKSLERRILRSEIRAPDIKNLTSELFISHPLEYAREMGWL